MYSNINDLVRFTVLAQRIVIQRNDIVTFNDPSEMIDFENDYNEGLSKWCDGVICEVPAALNNILNGMDSSTGIFTVPVSATYSFYFTILKEIMTIVFR